MMIHDQVTIAMLKDENYLLKKKLEKAVAGLQHISKATYEANPWTIVKSFEAIEAEKILTEIVNENGSGTNSNQTLQGEM
jgi:hypothetical protein